MGIYELFYGPVRGGFGYKFAVIRISIRYIAFFGTLTGTAVSKRKAVVRSHISAAEG